MCMCKKALAPKNLPFPLFGCGTHCFYCITLFIVYEIKYSSALLLTLFEVCFASSQNKFNILYFSINHNKSEITITKSQMVKTLTVIVYSMNETGKQKLVYILSLSICGVLTSRLANRHEQ